MSTEQPPRYHRIVLKLIGQALAGMQAYPLHRRALEWIVSEIETVQAAGVQVAVLVDGENLLGDKRTLSERWYVAADEVWRIDAAATMFNAVLLRSAFRARGKNAVALSLGSSEMSRALPLMNEGSIITLFHEGDHSTDCAAVEAAIKLKADALLMAKDLGGDRLYWPNREVDPTARPLATISYACAVEHYFQPITEDTAALAREHDLPIHLYSVGQPDALQCIIRGEDVGTVICRDGETFELGQRHPETATQADETTTETKAEVRRPSPYELVNNEHHLDLNDPHIREQIDRWLRSGHNPADLMVTRDGVVFFDNEAATERRMAKFWAEQDDSE